MGNEETPFIDSASFIYQCDCCDCWVLSGSFCSTAAKIVEQLRNDSWNKEDGP